MRLTHLSLTNFRNFTRLDVDVPSGAILLRGQNAQGKTSVLEAIFYLATMSSVFAGHDRQLIHFDEARKALGVARIVAAYQRAGREHNLEIRIIQEKTRNGTSRTRKEILLDGAKKKASEAVGHFNAVLFLPQMLSVVEGSPSERRRYLDLALSQVQPGYAANLRDYRQVISQRNSLLNQLKERGGDLDQLDYWDERLAKRGALIIHDRIRAIQELDQVAGRIHHQLTRGAEVLRLNYLPSYDPLPPPEDQLSLMDTPIDRTKVALEAIEAGFREKLLQLRPTDISRGVTSIGPTRDDLRFLGNTIDMRDYGSRGQVRTTMLTMKLAEVQWMHTRLDHWPVLLLDEIMAELDHDRRADLLEGIGNSDQALLTTTDLSLFDENFTKVARIWTIQAGRLSNDD
ncbi:MAG: DNA replication/repair protein RecF [Anaerolineae bacterium]|nr:DNA replication/repair protein RecF [Anaerolineae bacterium]